MNTPKYTAQIFEHLSKGQFITANSTDSKMKKYYNILDDDANFEQLYAHFQSINFILEKGNGYFYFTRVESRVNLERKIETAYKWIDILDFLKTFDSSFGEGYQFSASEITVRLDVNVDLKSKLENLKRFTKKTNYHDIVLKVLDMLEKENFIETTDETSSTYKVLSSFGYLEELIGAINITEELEDEVFE